MDEKTTVQDEVEEVAVPEVDEVAMPEEEEDELFDMGAADNIATQMLEQEQVDEMDQFKDIEGFAAKFSEKWEVTLPNDEKKINEIIKKQLLSKKTKKRA